MNSLISIIIPTYNRAHLIGETLDSMIAQTYTNWECIIIDDGSIDNTVEVIKKYTKNDSRFKYYPRPESFKKGPSSCRNYGFELSKGEFVSFFDSDDLFFSDALECYIKSFNEEIDVTVAKLEKIDFKSGNKINENSILSDNLIEDYFIGNISYYVCGPIWRKSFLDSQSVLFDENIRNLDDWDFNLRMLYKNPKIAYIQRPLMQYRFHDNSLSKEIYKLNSDELISKFTAFHKHLELIKLNKKANLLKLREFYKNRYKYLLREALVQDNGIKSYLFKELLKEQIKMFDFKGILKASTGYVLFGLFKKGYRFLK